MSVVPASSVELLRPSPVSPLPCLVSGGVMILYVRGSLVMLVPESKWGVRWWGCGITDPAADVRVCIGLFNPTLIHSVRINTSLGLCLCCLGKCRQRGADVLHPDNPSCIAALLYDPVPGGCRCATPFPVFVFWIPVGDFL